MPKSNKTAKAKQTEAKRFHSAMNRADSVIAPIGKMKSGKEIETDDTAARAKARLLAPVNNGVRSFGGGQHDGSAHAFLAHVTMARVGTRDKKTGVLSGGLREVLADYAVAMKGKNTPAEIAVFDARVSDARKYLEGQITKYLNRAPVCVSNFDCADCKAAIANPDMLRKL